MPDAVAMAYLVLGRVEGDAHRIQQAARGKLTYAANCVSCHGAGLAGSYGPPLAGPYFDGKWRGKPLTDLLAKVHTMPPSRPDSLGDAAYADLVAHILAVNRFAAGDAELPADPALATGIALGSGVQP